MVSALLRRHLPDREASVLDLILNLRELLATACLGSVFLRHPCKREY
jgi:hypothetical protein